MTDEKKWAPGTAASGAIGEDGYRYLLWREVDPMFGKGTLLFVMFNPSTANDRKDDPTMRRVIGFAQKLGVRTVEVVNLFAYRTPYPLELVRVRNPVGPLTDVFIRHAVGRATRTIVAWGAPPSQAIFRNAVDRRIDEVLPMLNNPECLGMTAQGYPRHPVRLAKSAKLTPYNGDEMKRPKPCYLCQRFGRPHGKRHGVTVEGMSLDFSCPTSKETYDQDLVKVLGSLKAIREPRETH